jgi:hypothetical protein
LCEHWRHKAAISNAKTATPKIALAVTLGCRGVVKKELPSIYVYGEYGIYMTRTRSYGAGFTLVEIRFVVAMIALLAAIAVPGFLQARKRSQAGRILSDLHIIDLAVHQNAVESNRKAGDTVPVSDWMNRLNDQ